MISQDLLDYIKKQIVAGSSPVTITSDLLKNGWSQADISEAFNTINTAQVPQPQPQPQPLNSVTQPAQTFTQTAYTSTQTQNTSHASHSFFKILSGVFLVLLVGSSVALGAYYFITTNSGAPYESSNLISGVLNQSSQIKSSANKVSFRVFVETREESTRELVISVDNEAEERKAQFERDYERSRFVENFERDLWFEDTVPVSLESFQKNSIRPESFIRDPLTNEVYEYQKINDKQFVLRITFETEEALQKIADMKGFQGKTKPEINGNTVSFTETSDTWLRLSSVAPKTTLESVRDMFSVLTPGMDIAGSLLTQFQLVPDASLQGQVVLDGQGDLGDLAYKVNVELLVNDPQYYVRVNNMPSFGFSIPKGEWIKFDLSEQAEQESGFSSGFGMTSAAHELYSGLKSSRDDIVQAITLIAEVADAEQLFTISNPQKENVGGTTLYRYDMSLNRDAVPSFYSALIQKIETLQLDSNLTQDFIPPNSSQDVLKMLERPDVQMFMDYLETNAMFVLWVDSNGYPVKLENTLKIAFGNDVPTLVGKQVVSTLVFELSNINEPIQIDIPTNTRSINEVTEELFGESLFTARERANEAMIRANLSSLRVSAELNFEEHDGYGKKAFALGKCSKTPDTLFGDESVFSLIKDASHMNLEGTICGSRLANGKVSEFVVFVPYSLDSDVTAKSGFCVDHRGTAREILDSSLITAYKCP